MRPLLAALRRAVTFAGLGAAIAAICLAVGALRALLATLMGGHMAPLDAADARLFAFYVGGFVAAGALFGLLRPLFSGRLGIALGCMLAGVVVMFAIGVREGKGITRFDWIALPTLGIIFGGALAYGYLRDS